MQTVYIFSGFLDGKFCIDKKGIVKLKCLFFFLINYLFIYLWLCWVFVSVRGLSLVAASGGHSSSRPLLLRSTGSRRAGSVVVAHGPSCSAACGILPDQGSNPCGLHWQADSQPLRHRGSPSLNVFKQLGMELKYTNRKTDILSMIIRYNASSKSVPL